MAKDIEVAVVCQNLEAVVTNAIPLIQDLFYFEYLCPGPVSKGEPQGPLIGLVA
jgi:hypothetical protein